MIEALLIIAFVAAWYISVYVSSTAFSSFLMIIGPYVLIILINNLIAIRFGFYSVSESSIIVTMISFPSFLSGAAIVAIAGRKKQRVVEKIDTDMRTMPDNFYSIANMFSFVIGISCFIAILLRLLSVSDIRVANLEILRLDGPLAHGLIAARVLVPVLLEQGFRKKKKFYFVTSVIVLLCTFASFTKYHIISQVLYMYVYFFWKNKKRMIVLTIGMIGIVIILFALNYLIDFISKGMSYDVYGKDFYVRHLWKYIAGGTINLNNIVNNSSITYSAGDFIIDTFFTYPNMFLRKLGITEVLPSGNFGSATGFMFIGENATSNVRSLIATMYNSGNILTYSFFVSVLGAISELCWRVVRYSIKMPFVLLSATILSYMLFSFFHNMWGGSIMPWEGMVFSILLPYAIQKVYLLAEPWCNKKRRTRTTKGE